MESPWADRRLGDKPMLMISDEALVSEIEAALEAVLPTSTLHRIIHDVSSTEDPDVLVVETNLVSRNDQDEHILGTETIRYRRSDRQILELESDSTE